MEKVKISDFCKKLKLKFEEGDLKFNKGADLNTKEEGLQIIIEGMKLLQQQITSETDNNIQQILKQTYKQRYDDLESKVKGLEAYKKQEITIPSTNILTYQYSIDNSDLRKKVDFKFTKGNDLDTKEQGLKIIMDGMKLLQQWINRENGSIQESLKQNYKSRYEDIESKLKIIESYKKKGEIQK